MEDFENIYNKNKNDYNNNAINNSSMNLIQRKQSKYKEQFINDYLDEFSKKSNNELLKELTSNLIKFRKLCINQKSNKSLPLSDISSNYLLFHHLEKNLIEITYLPRVEIQNEKIKILYEWYRKILDKNLSLKKIMPKSYSELNLINNKQYINDKNNEIIEKENINKIEKIEKINPSKNKRVLSSSVITQNSSSTNGNSNWDFMTYLYSNKNCLNSSNNQRNSSAINSEHIKNEEKDIKKIIFPIIPQELKYSYSYYHPCPCHKSIEIEDKIIQSKMKLLSEKRNIENINQKINEFGFQRAKLKENINNKYEIKKLITMYVNNHINEGLNVTSPLLKKYITKKKIILSKPIKNEKVLYINKNNSSGNILDTDKNNNKNKLNILIKKDMLNKKKEIIHSKSTLSPSKKETNIIFEYKKEKTFSNSYNFNNIDEKKDNIQKTDANKNKSIKNNERLFFGINHIKIYMDKIHNIDKNTLLITNNKKTEIFDIKMKLSEKINKNIIQDNSSNNILVKDNATQIFSSEALFEQKRIYLNSLGKLNKLQSKDSDLGLAIQDENKEEENNDDQSESSYHYHNLKLSAFHLDNLKKIENSRNNNNLNNQFIKNKYKSVDLNEKKRIEIYNNYKLYKNNLLVLRKNMDILKKMEYAQLKNKMRKIKFLYNNRYDNIDIDKEDDGFHNEKDEEYNNKNINYNKNTLKNEKIKRYQFKENNQNNKNQKENSLLNAIINPDNNIFYSLYYYPRLSSKLLERK